MKITDAGIKIIKDSEGLRLKAYLCPAGIWTIGWGHTKDVTEDMEINEETAEMFLVSDLGSVDTHVRSLVHVPLSDNQFSALVSFAFNLGAGALAGSTLLKKLNSGDYQEAADEFPKWDHIHWLGKSKELAGLHIRRQKEKEMFLA